MVAHLAQVSIVEPLQVREVDALGVDVGIRREGWLVPGLGDEGPRDAASLAAELGYAAPTRGASTRRMAFTESRRPWSRLRSEVIRARSAVRSSALRLRTSSSSGYHRHRVPSPLRCRSSDRWLAVRRGLPWGGGGMTARARGLGA